MPKSAPKSDSVPTLGAGDLMFYDSSRAFDGLVVEDGTQVQVQFPRAMLPHPWLIDDLIGRRLSGGGLSTLISGYLRELVDHRHRHLRARAPGR